MIGWYKMWRGWMDHPLFKQEPYSKREAWIWLVENAAYKETTVNIDGYPVRLQRGQLSYAVRFLAKKWGWHKSKAQRFMEKLKEWDMIDTQTDTRQQIITICNYSKYQDDENKTDTRVNEKQTQERYGSDTKKKKLSNKEKNNLNVTIRSLDDLKACDLSGHYHAYFQENFSNTDIFEIKAAVIGYCEANGKKYKDYWAAMQNFARREQKKYDQNRPKAQATPQLSPELEKLLDATVER